ncbi:MULTISPECIES: SsgA family sporulation/cell division regulator [Streptomyces]|uniref:SsgA family sporulation/cell division regulator n=2 Tax=Streptomyces viridosporus TaxID=67581 RepID=A0ABX6AHG2_STRVD|nr:MULTISPECIES: SsgA family sporulation/cell division regulator [Streptomyces]EFE68972.1 cell division protein [Streptomyces viridosporus ATCC 14672]PWJ05287.1 SsgA family sporulation/cell division regulator [Streptomyces sp. NWU49]QEU86203.1 SsgA family sporulation/cell division regulator [Streptomyces viridosporus T7A]
MSVVEQHARAHIVTDTLEEDDGAVPVVLRYDPGRDPRRVLMRLPGTGAREWTVERELLERGLRTPAGLGEVRVWPCGRVQTVVEFHSAHGVSVVQFDTKTLARFLRRTYVAAAEPVPH